MSISRIAAFRSRMTARAARRRGSNLPLPRERNLKATFIRDLTQPNCLPDSLFDCIILTQKLHLLFDMREGLATLYRALKPGGVLLMTVPGISEVNSGQEWGETWYWSLTVLSARRLLKEQFKSEDVHVESHGNVFAAAAFLYGLACEEVPATDLDMNDPSYPVTIAARAIKTTPA
jgi:SAM-dependent methyltransferase